jgi:hypothetical protein
MAGLGITVGELRRAIEVQHGGRATLVQSVPVVETFDGETVWEGVVHVFDLTGNPNATRAYAGRRRLKGPTNADFLPCYTWGRLSRQWTP